MATAESPWLFRWREAIKDSARSSTERLVAHVLSDYGDKHGNDIRPSVGRLVHDSGLSDPCVRKTLKALREGGWIDWTERYGPYGQDSSIYRLLIPAAFVPDPYVAVTKRRCVSETPETQPGIARDPTSTEQRPNVDHNNLSITSPETSPSDSAFLERFVDAFIAARNEDERTMIKFPKTMRPIILTTWSSWALKRQACEWPLAKIVERAASAQTRGGRFVAYLDDEYGNGIGYDHVSPDGTYEHRRDDGSYTVNGSSDCWAGSAA